MQHGGGGENRHDEGEAAGAVMGFLGQHVRVAGAEDKDAAIGARCGDDRLDRPGHVAGKSAARLRQALDDRVEICLHQRCHSADALPVFRVIIHGVGSS